MNSGVYAETLASGGELRVTAEDWSIQYYFPGPDLRYKGSFVTGNKVSEYIDALRVNWIEYERMEALVPPGGSLEKPGAAGMTVRVGGYWPGVAIQHHHVIAHSKGQVEQVIQAYEYAIKRAFEVQELLRSLG